MSTFQPGDVLLITFPTTGSRTSKQRPAVVLADTGDDDVVVAPVTSHAARDRYDVHVAQWQAAGLMMPSVVRVNKLAALDKRLVRRRLGSLQAEDWARVLDGLHSLFGSPDRGAQLHTAV